MRTDIPENFGTLYGRFLKKDDYHVTHFDFDFYLLINSLIATLPITLFFYNFVMDN